MNASPFYASRFPPGYLWLPAPPETALALLRQIDTAEQDAEGQASVAALDPVLSFELLSAAPPEDGTGFDLRAVLARIMASLGPDLLRAWCLDKLATRAPRTEPGCGLRESLHGLFVAELALHLAVETHQGGFQEAYAAGLLHDVGQLWLAHHAEGHAGMRAAAGDERVLSAGELERYGIGHAGLGGALASRCALPPEIVDAIHLHHCPREAIADSAPLARVVWLAEEIAGSRFEVSAHDLGVAAEVSGLDPATLSDMRSDVARRLASLTKQYGIPAAGARTGGDAMLQTVVPARGPAGAWGKDDSVAAATVSALARSALLDAGEEPLVRLGAACRLLLDLDAPLLLEFDARSGQLGGVAHDDRPWAEQVRIAASNPASAVAEAYRASGSVQSVFGPDGPERSAADWQLGRRLGASGLLCESWVSGGRRGVAVFGLAGSYDDDKVRAAVRRGIVAGVAGVHVRRQCTLEIERDAEQELRARYRDHYRRLAHEASNPLAAMKTYLAVIRRQVGEGATPDAEFGLLDKELDRIAAMVRNMAQPPEIPPQAAEAVVEVGGLLEDLRLLYAEGLFGSRGIEFDLHGAAQPVRGRIPRDALKQVLLNLFKNASEALQAGQRFSVSLIPAASLGGVRCLAIRLADDGPGMPPEMMAGLFERSRSSKGGEHQGVGLVLVRETLARYGASVSCESDGRTGTAFQVYIPLADSA